MKLSHILVSLLCCSLLSACHSTRKAVTSTTETLVPGNQTWAFDTMPSWTDVEVPMHINILSPSNVGISARAKMVRDKSVDISLRMLGFEVGRMYLTADSIYGYIKMNKVYFAESLSDLTARYPVSIGDVQNLLTGYPFLIGGSNPVNSADFIIEPDTEGILILPKKMPDDLQYGFLGGYDGRLIRFVSGYEKQNIQLQCDYDDFSNEEISAAGKVSVSATLPGAPVKAAITWKWESAKWNKGAVTSWSIPRGYKRIRPQEMLNNLPK